MSSVDRSRAGRTRLGADALVAPILVSLVFAAGCASDDASSGEDADTTGTTSGTPGTTGATMPDTSADSASSGTETNGSDEANGSDTTSDGPATCTQDAECDDGNICNGLEVCSAEMVCAAGEPPKEPTACGDGMVCVDGECLAATCGNAVIEPGEHCDDGNADPHDGCDASCRYEFFYRTYELTLMPSPAASFCDRPTSALGDSLNPFALEADNARRKADIDAGLDNGIFRVIGLDDPSAMTDETIEFRTGALAMPDPARGDWPTDGSNPVDWWFLLDEATLADDGGLPLRIPDVPLTNGSFVGAGAVSAVPIPEFVDHATRGRFDFSTPADTPTSPPDELADGFVTPQEIIGDGDDEGICGNLTVASMAAQPVDSSLADCLECPGTSRTYTPCPGDVVTADCNSALDAIVGGCALGANCASAFQVVMGTQPDVDNGGFGPLVNEPTDNNKVPTAATDGNLNGYSAYFRFRARRVHVTGTQ